MKARLYIFIFSTTLATNTFAWVNDGGYVGVEIGAANQFVNFNSNNFSLNTGSANLTSSQTGFLTRANLGYQFNSYSALELGANYSWGGNYQYPNSDGTIQIGSTTLDGSYLLSLPITQSNFSVFGRIGLAYSWINSTGYNDASGVTGGAFTDVLGAGMKYRLGKYTTIRMEWIADGLWQPVGLSADSQQIGNLSSQNFLIGVNYYF